MEIDKQIELFKPTWLYDWNQYRDTNIKLSTYAPYKSLKFQKIYKSF